MRRPPPAPPAGQQGRSEAARLRGRPAQGLPGKPDQIIISVSSWRFRGGGLGIRFGDQIVLSSQTRSFSVWLRRLSRWGYRDQASVLVGLQGGGAGRPPVQALGGLWCRGRPLLAQRATPCDHCFPTGQPTADQPPANRPTAGVPEDAAGRGPGRGAGPGAGAPRPRRGAVHVHAAGVAPTLQLHVSAMWGGRSLLCRGQGRTGRRLVAVQGSKGLQRHRVV